jgi:asparagine synthase (glutamine-hydrolysing)
MCGITGFFSYNNTIDTKKYYDAHLKIAHRGPDDEGFLYRGDGGIEYLKGDDTIDELKSKEHIADKQPSSLIFGHRRLSIIDLTSAGHQPFVYENLSLVYNGEIYNYPELRTELKELGYSFTTNSDTEVFLKAYHCWGVGAFNKFNGMWAAAIYDISKDNIVLTRDRFGIKPLYYSYVDNNLIFGSEIKFVSSFFDKLHPNEQMVYEYLRFNYIDHTNQTLFENILQLEPNSYIEFSRKGIKISQYWDMKEEKGVSKVEIEDTLNDAINLRMRSDVEVGSLLSGGIDSSLILGIINNKKYATKFQTFSAVFKEEEFSEKIYIDKFKANNLELKKHFIYPKPEELKKLIEELVYTQEEPFRSLSVLSQYNLYKYIKNNTEAKVLLNGQGADEIFTGYTSYYYTYLLELLSTFKLKVLFKEFKYFADNRGLSSLTLIKQLVITFISRYFRKSNKYKIFKYKYRVAKKDNKFKGSLKNSLWNSLTISPLREYLRYEDKNSMRFSLESRLPFLDFRVVQSAFSLKNEGKINNGLSKVMLREIAKDIIPNETLNRKDKMGFITPQEVWQKTILKEEFDNVFKDIKENGLFDFIDNVKLYNVYEEYTDNKMNDWAFIWRCYVIYKWKKKWDV